MESRFSKHALLLGRTDFIYREVAFAILSLASGEYGLIEDQWPLLARRDGREPDLQVRVGSASGPSSHAHCWKRCVRIERPTWVGARRLHAVV